MQAPRTYRLYRVDARGKLLAGEWVSAADDQDARQAALRLCDGGPAVEIWEGRRLVGKINCPKPAGGDARPASPRP